MEAAHYHDSCEKSHLLLRLFEVYIIAIFFPGKLKKGLYYRDFSFAYLDRLFKLHRTVDPCSPRRRGSSRILSRIMSLKVLRKYNLKYCHIYIYTMYNKKLNIHD